MSNYNNNISDKHIDICCKCFFLIKSISFIHFTMDSGISAANIYVNRMKSKIIFVQKT